MDLARAFYVEGALRIQCVDANPRGCGVHHETPPRPVVPPQANLGVAGHTHKTAVATRVLKHPDSGRTVHPLPHTHPAGIRAVSLAHTDRGEGPVSL